MEWNQPALPDDAGCGLCLLLASLLLILVVSSMFR
jgi:hypothetical protein